MSQTGKIILSIILTALIAGAGTYYLTNRTYRQNKSDLEGRIDKLQAQVRRFQNENQESSQETVSDEEKNQESSETEEGNVQKSVYQEAKDYCESRAETNENVVASTTFVENDDGYFVECSISTGPTGYTSIGKKINGKWKKLWEGNGIIKQSIVDNNDIPYSIHRGNTASDEKF